MLGASGSAHAAPCEQVQYIPPTPKISVSNTSPAYWEMVAFDGAGSTAGKTRVWSTENPQHTCRFQDFDDPITSYSWDLGTGGGPRAGAQASIGYLEKGTFTVTLTVSTANRTATATLPIDVRGVVASFDVAETASWSKTLDAGASGSPYAPVAYSWDFGDGSSGSGARPTHAYTAPGSYQASLTVKDRNGFTESATRPVVIAPDKAGPAVSIAKPARDDIYLVGQHVNASYSCSDAASGMQSCDGPVPSGAGLDTSGVGDKRFTVTGKDVAGNTTSSTVAYHVVTAVPRVTITAPADGAQYARGSAVPANFTCAVLFVSTTCTGGVANGAPFDTSTLGRHAFAVTARTSEGATVTKTAAYDVVDKTAPSATIPIPIEGSVIPRGTLVRAVYDCHDEPGGSGLASCTQEGPVDTSTPGPKTFTVRATDRAGNVGVYAIHYVVSDYPVLPSSVTLKYVYGAHPPSIVVKRLGATRVPAGARIAVRCSGRGCPKRARRSLVAKRDGALVVPGWAGAALRPGATLKVSVTQPLATGVQTVWRVGRDLGVRKTELCMPPGGKPRKC